jgi:serine/threonine protein kinase
VSLSNGPAAGQVIAKKYVLDRPAGFGGMAQLWVATNQSTGAEVCVKLLVPDSDKGHDDESVERFRREAYAAASLSHRAIVRVFDLLELDERGDVVTNKKSPHSYAIVMELLHGETLGEVLVRKGSLGVDEALDLFLPVVSALGHAHRASVIHRDLKPDNIFLAAEPDGHVIPKVLDFGVSKLERADALTSDGVVVGTPTFMSPEQAKGSRRIDARSDVFSAGILLYVMLGGRNPFEDAPTFEATLDAVIRRDVPPLTDIPPAVWEVIERSIAKDPSKRWNDCTEMGIALRKASGRKSTTESDPGFTGPISTPSVSQRPVTRDPSDPNPNFISAADIGGASSLQRRRIVVGVVGVAALMVVVALIVSALEPSKRSSAKAKEPPAAATTALPAGSVAMPLPVGSAPEPPATSSAAPQPSSAKSAAPAVRPVGSGVRRGPGTRRPHPPHIARDPGF